VHKKFRAGLSGSHTQTGAHKSALNERGQDRRHLNEAGFRTAVLLLLLASGVTLVV
jgi:hypothetical protein